MLCSFFYQALFGKESLQCGIVRRQEHRLWVHVVGTECDLQEVSNPLRLSYLSYAAHLCPLFMGLQNFP